MPRFIKIENSTENTIRHELSALRALVRTTIEERKRKRVILVPSGYFQLHNQQVNLKKQ